MSTKLQFERSGLKEVWSKKLHLEKQFITPTFQAQNETNNNCYDINKMGVM